MHKLGPPFAQHTRRAPYNSCLRRLTESIYVGDVIRVAPHRIASEGADDTQLWRDDAVDESAIVKVFTQQAQYLAHTLIFHKR